jgi:hypothetical protein
VLRYFVFIYSGAAVTLRLLVRPVRAVAAGALLGILQLLRGK